MTQVALLVREFVTPPDWPDGRPLPTTATIREIDLSVAGKKIEIQFSQGNETIALNGDYGIKDLLKDVGSGRFNFPRPIEPAPRGKHRSPLSLNNQGLNYIVYRLADRNWQFSQNGAPITIASAVANKGAYFESRRIDPDGAADDGSVEKNHCRAAYFIADADAASAGQPEYEDLVNLHVDLVYHGTDGDKQFVPIIIDPDIRHPGGSEP